MHTNRQKPVHASPDGIQLFLGTVKHFGKNYKHFYPRSICNLPSKLFASPFEQSLAIRMLLHGI